ncbi:MAG TPA: hypothetical protein VKZ60_00750 [Chloroflexota bacterium]|nr:hypothetical protein [Chloroflexota bacterium]
MGRRLIALLGQLAYRGIVLRVRGGVLEVSMPGALSKAERAQLRAQRAAVIAYLRQPPRCTTCGSTRWWAPPHADAWAMCAVCHPPADTPPRPARISARDDAATIAACRRLAEQQGWPRVPLIWHLAVAEGATSWERWLESAEFTPLRRAMQVLEARGDADALPATPRSR